MKGFKDFILRGNLIELAVAFIIGAAFAALVTAFTKVILEAPRPRPAGRRTSTSGSPGG